MRPPFVFLEYSVKKSIMNKWTKALRSGKYKQGKYDLCSIGPKGKEKFCCLGVLTDLYLKERKSNKKEHGIANFEIYDKKDYGNLTTKNYMPKWSCNGQEGHLPLEVAKWAGFNIKNKYFTIGSFIDLHGKTQFLSDCNDAAKQMSFKKIADLIENNFKNI
jgi:hypothetical protein